MAGVNGVWGEVRGCEGTASEAIWGEVWGENTSSVGAAVGAVVGALMNSEADAEILDISEKG